MAVVRQLFMVAFVLLLAVVTAKKGKGRGGKGGKKSSESKGDKKEEGDFDYIIVGGGLAGSVLANRLSESGEHSVLLLNVAGTPPGAYSGPVMLTDEFIIKQNLSADDGLRARILQPGYSPVPAFSTSETGSSPARWLGGSSLVGLSIYLRDHPELLDSWGPGWSAEELKPFFRRVERGLGEGRTYGVLGPYTIPTEPAYVHELSHAFVKAASEAGLDKVRDLNTVHGPAVGITPVAQHADGTKVHAYDAYLRPALDRPNLEIWEGARADRLIVEGGKCSGVAYRNLTEGEDYLVTASKEVVLASGYIYTPRLLFLSGIGDAEELQEVGLRVVHDLPAVGKNLTSARFTPLAWKTETPTLARLVGTPISPSNYTPLPASYGSVVQEATARFRSKAASKEDPKSKRPDVVVTFLPLYYSPSSAPLQYSLQGEPWPLKTNAYTLLVTLGETEAQGTVSFPSASPDVSPVVRHHALTEKDKAVAEEAVAWASEVGSASALGGTEPVDNGAGSSDTFSAIYDGRGTCRMGKSEKDSVVDFDLLVHGIEGLRIVDGSVIPKGSPYLAAPEVLALAEKGAALILGKAEEQKEDEEVLKEVLEEPPAPTYTRYTVALLEKAVGRHAPLLEMVQYLAEPEDARLAALNFTVASLWLPAVASAALLGAAAAWVVAAGRKREEDAINVTPLLA